LGVDVRPLDPDDIDARFEALVARFDDDEPVAAQEEPEPAKRSSRGLAAIVIIALSALVAAVGLVVNLRPDWLGVIQRPPPKERSALTPTAARAAGGPRELTLPSAEFFDAYAGSKAAGFANGVHGLEMPDAKARGGLSKKQVKTALDRTRRMLAAAYLDPGTILGRQPNELAELLEPDQREWFLERLDSGEADDTRRWVFSLSAGTADLTSDVVKVDGETEVAEAPDGNGIVITTDYLFVYAVNRPGDRKSMTRLVAHHRARIHADEKNGKVLLSVELFTRSVAGHGCGFDDAFVHPSYRDQSPRIQPTGVPIDPYDRLGDRSIKVGCFAAIPA
jgi:hypothetical protein